MTAPVENVPSDARRLKKPGNPLLVMADFIPVAPVGTLIVLRRLLEHFSSEEVVVVGRAPVLQERTPPSAHYRAVSIPAPRPGLRGDRYWRMLWTIPAVAAGLYAAIRFRPRAILVVYPDASALLAGYILHCLTGKPLLPYFGDLYLEAVRDGWQLRVARWLQPRVFRRAARILVVNAGMADYYRTRYGIATTELPTCINEPIPDGDAFVEQPSRAAAPFVVAYSGNVNQTRLPLLRELTSAIGGKPEFEIRYFTPATREDLKAQGLWADNVKTRFIGDQADLIRELALCSVLFLPLTFDVEEYGRDTMATSFGIKSYEYFLAGRPVLVQSPEGYFLTRFYRERECGYVVTEPSAAALLDAIQRLSADGPLRARLVGRAVDAAREFTGARIAERFRGVLAEVSA